MGETNEYFTEWNESFESFDQMNLHENLLRGIYAYGACSCSAPCCCRCCGLCAPAAALRPRAGLL